MKLFKNVRKLMCAHEFYEMVDVVGHFDESLHLL